MESTIISSINPPLVCIAMPAYNASKTISLAITSILSQTYQNWNLFIIDDGSTDTTLEIISTYNDPRITILSDGKRQGLATRLNQIIDQSEAKFIARLDADDVAYPDRLRKQVEFLLANPAIDLLGTGAVVFNRNGKAVGSYPLRIRHADICQRPWSGFYLAHPTWMGRMSWFKKYRYRGGMPTAEDQDLLLRSYRDSHFACLPEILTGYRQESLTLRKIIPGRFHFSKAVIRDAWNHSDYLQILVAPLVQVAKVLVDVFSIATGFVSVIRRHRALPINENISREWDKLWLQLQK
jgi:glycosyltransferase involved in cell wall biosynthesis